jgi:hypothetical protein
MCAYGHVVRISSKVPTAVDAAKECFGVVDRVTVIEAGTRIADIRSDKFRKPLMERLKVLHKKKTGNEIQG